MDNQEQDNNEVQLTPVDGEGGEAIKFDELPVFNNPTCEHEFVKEDGQEIPGTYTEVCIKPRCGVGRIVRL